MLSTIVQLALKRVWRTKFSVLCRVLALAAIMIPILIIFGLKHGIVSALKERLVQNPATMEVWPTEGVEISTAMVKEIASWPECGFVVPAVGAAYSSVGIAPGGCLPQPGDRCEILPTGPGDPLLVKTGQRVPGEGEAVLTEPLAAELGVAPGKRVTVCAWRNAETERQVMSLAVVGVVPAEYSHNRRQVYAPLDTTTRIEQFIVEGKGRKGESAKISGPAYSGIVTDCTDSAAIAPLARTIPALRQDTAGAHRLPRVPADMQALYSADRRITPQTVDVLLENARALGINAYPWVEPAHIQLPQEAGGFSLQVLPLDQMHGSADSCQPPPVLYLNPAQCRAHLATLTLHAPQGDSSVKCGLESLEQVPQGVAYAAPQLAALLRRATQVCLVWDYEEGLCYHPVLSFHHMRLYADSLENTEALMDRLNRAGVPCNARVNAIRQVLTLEKSLDSLFLVVCLGAGLGAAVSFGMSLFNAAELHRRDYALLQLQGAWRGWLAAMPLVDAAVSAVCAALVSAVVFFAASSVIGYMFAETAGQGALCRLEPRHFCAFLGICIGLAAAASLAASLKVLTISPSEIIRES